MSRIVAWNVCGGGGTRVDAITSALASLAPSVVVLSEVTAARLREWKRALADIGLTHQTDTIALATAADPYALIVATRTPHQSLPWEPSCPDPNRAIAVRVEGLTVIGVHAPDQPQPAAPFYRWLQGFSATSLESDAVIIGDFNADQDGEGLRLARHFRTLTEAGWIHGLRHLQHDRDHTSWGWQHGGFAIDHCLVSPSLVPRLVNAEVLASVNGTMTAGPGHRISDGALSDHRPLLLDLRPADEPVDGWRRVVQFEVPGRPATFATEHATAWKTSVANAAETAMLNPSVKPAAPGSRFMLRVEFRTPIPTRVGEAWDIDNLVKPTTDALGAVLGYRQWKGPVQVADDSVDRLEASKRTVQANEKAGAVVEVLTFEAG